MHAAVVMVIMITACAEYFAAAYPAREAKFPGGEQKISGTVNCLHQQHPCLREGLLPHTDDKCYAPLERGPCPRGHVIMLDTHRVAEGLKGLCMEQRCPSGLVPLEGRCMPNAQVRKLLCASGPLHLDPAGNPLCGEFPGWKNLLQSYVQCSLKKKRQVKWTGRYNNKRVTWVHNALCAVQNDGNCGKGVSGVQPKLILTPEK
ncbi:hypothetical protein R5R35_011784 [Gryllus longicercus]|uniref:Accessory gland protein n=1 Tax=Gryllus longicercus TaxID=2509291 RepID=A0AAN9ZCN1_9ORTH